MNRLQRPATPSAMAHADGINEAEPGGASQGTRSETATSPEQALFRLDIRRSLQMHRRLAQGVAVGFLGLGLLYLLAQVFWFRSWPVYLASSVVYVHPTPARVLPSEGGPPRWPFDSNTYETYIQQQMMNVSRDDVLIAAVHKLNGFAAPGESDQSAAQRLVRALEVTRVPDAYQFSISARAGNAQSAAEIANAVTAAYIESSSRDEQAGDAQRVAMLKEEKQRVLAQLEADHAEQDALNKQLGVASVGAAVPDHYDEDITQIRTELARARTDHDEAEQKFAALGAGHGASSAAIDAQADEMVANDAGLVSMKQAANARRATLISQMANLTPANPQYKQDEAELAKINSSLDAALKDLRAKASARIQLQLRTELQRTGGVEAELNGQLRQLVGAATSATPKMQRAGDLAADIARLQARFAAVNEQLQDVLLEDTAPAAAHQVSPAAAPLERTKSGVVRNAILIGVSGIFFAVLAAVAAHKRDPRIYLGADVEQVLGFTPLAQLPNFHEVSEGVAEESMLRLASALEHARQQGSLKNCIFTGTGSGVGVSTLVRRVGHTLEAMGRPTVVVDATGAHAPQPGSLLREEHVGREAALVPVARMSRPSALLQRMAAETRTEEESLVLTDTAPLTISAETEYLARYVDGAIVVIESGVTTRAQLRDAAKLLQRLHVGAVGFVLNRVGLSRADAAFRASVDAMEKHVQAQANAASRRAEWARPSPEKQSDSGEAALSGAPAARSKFEPEVAAAAAALARFSPRTVAEPEGAATVCDPSPMAAPPVAEAARKFPRPLRPAPLADAQTGFAPPFVDEPAKHAAAEPAAVSGSVSGSSVPPKNAPLAQVENGQPQRVTAVSGVSLWPHSDELATPSNPMPTGPKDASGVEVASAPVERKRQPEAAAATESNGIGPAGNGAPGSGAMEPAADTETDVPWWLSHVHRETESSLPPVIWQAARGLSGYNRQEGEAPGPVAAQAVATPLPPRMATREPLEGAPTELPLHPVEADDAHADRISRLSGLRNLLFVLGVKSERDAEQPDEADRDGETSDSAGETNGYERSEYEVTGVEPQEAATWSVGGASSRMVTAMPEFLPPGPAVIEFDKESLRPSEASKRKDRRAAADGVSILPSKRGQYKKV